MLETVNTYLLETSMYPPRKWRATPPPGNGLEVAVRQFPPVGGDAVRFAHHGNQYSLLLVDAVGNGECAAPMATTACDCVASSRAAGGPGDVLASAGREFFRLAQADAGNDFIPPLATAILVQLSLDTGKFTAASAGHPSFFQILGGDVAAGPDLSGLPFGAVPDPSYPNSDGRHEDGGLLVLPSDGLLDARSDDGSRLDQDGFVALLRKVAHKVAAAPIDQVADEIVAALHRFGEPCGDATLVVCRRTG